MIVCGVNITYGVLKTIRLIHKEKPLIRLFFIAHVFITIHS